MYNKKCFLSLLVCMGVFIFGLIMFVSCVEDHQNKTTPMSVKGCSQMRYNVDTVLVDGHHVVILSNGIGGEYAVMGCFESATCPACHNTGTEKSNDSELDDTEF